MNKKLRISPKEVKEITIREKEKMDKFHKKHWNNTDDIIAIILKSHLYIESLIDDIITSNMVKPNRILEKKFSTKLDIFEAMNLDVPSKVLVEKLRKLNKLRNQLAHKLDKKLNEADIAPLLKDVQVKKDFSLKRKLSFALQHLIGYLHFITVLNRNFTYILMCLRNKAVFSKDVGYREKEALAHYPIKELSDIIGYMRME